MTDRPIPFSAPMIRAILDGRKTQTRRVLRPQPEFKGGFGDYHDAEEWGWEDEDGYHTSVLDIVPNGFRVGDRLWVREAWRAMDGQDAFSGAKIGEQCLDAGYKRAWSPTQFEADGERVNWICDPHTFGTRPGRYRHARFMPRWASRLTLTVTDVRVQRLQNISEADAIAEGVDAVPLDDVPRQAAISRRSDFAGLWNNINGPDAWDANPWLVALTFTVARGNIDDLGAAG